MKVHFWYFNNIHIRISLSFHISMSIFVIFSVWVMTLSTIHNTFLLTLCNPSFSILFAQIFKISFGMRILILHKPDYIQGEELISFCFCSAKRSSAKFLVMLTQIYLILWLSSVESFIWIIFISRCYESRNFVYMNLFSIWLKFCFFFIISLYYQKNGIISTYIFIRD